MKKTWFIPCILCVIATLVRFLYSSTGLLWLDEIQTVTYLDKGFSSILGFARQGAVVDVHPPLYYLILWLWSRLSESDVWLRSLSVLLGVGSIPLMVLLGRYVSVDKSGFWASLFLVFSVPHILYSVEVRMYSLIVFLALASLLFWLRWYETQRGSDAFLWLLSTIAGCYTYHFFLFVPLFEGGHWLFTSLKNRKRLQRGGVLFFLLAFLYVPGILRLQSQLGFVSHDYWGLAPDLRELPGLLLWYVAGSAWRGHSSLQAAIAGSWLILFGYGWYKSSIRLDRLLLFAGLFFVPPLVVFVLSQKSPLFQPRYFLFTLPIFLLITASGFAALRRPMSRVMLAVVLLATNGVSLFLVWDRPERIDMRSVIQTIDREGKPDEAAFHLIPRSSSGETYIVARYYRPEWRQSIIGSLPEISREARPAFNPSDFQPRIEEAMTEGRCFWCIVMRAFLAPDDSLELVRTALPAGTEIVGRYSFHLVDCFRCCPAEDSPGSENIVGSESVLTRDQ